MADRYDLLQPAAIEASVRSLPRRFRQALAHLPPDPADRERLLTLTEPGRRVCAAVAGVVPSLAAGEESIRRITRSDDARAVAPVQPPALSWTAVTAEADRIETAAVRFAELVRGLAARDWNRTGTDADGGPRAVIDVARDTVRRSVEALRTVEQVLGADAS